MSKNMFIIFGVLGFLLPNQLAAQTNTVSFVTEPSKEGGFLVAITEAAFERVGYSVEIKYVLGARAIHDVTTGASEALLGFFYTDERAESMLYSESIGTTQLTFFKLRDSRFQYYKLEDLNGLTVGTIIGAKYTPEFDSATMIKKELVSDQSSNIRKLLSGRVGLILDKRITIQNLLTTEFKGSAGNVVAVDPPLATIKCFNAFSRKFPGFEIKNADFNKGLEIITKDGTLKKIMDRSLHE